MSPVRPCNNGPVITSTACNNMSPVITAVPLCPQQRAQGYGRYYVNAKSPRNTTSFLTRTNSFNMNVFIMNLFAACF